MTVIRLENSHGMTVDVMSFGARISSIRYPDKAGHIELLARYDTDEEFYQDKFYLGATCGRVCNRISGGGFTLDGTFYPLKANNGDYCLHGGEDNFSGREWDVQQRTKSSVILSLQSDSGDQGFPGKVDVSVNYRLDNHNQLTIDYQATTTEATPINLTNHCYFNLGETDCRQLHLQINADNYLQSNSDHAPTGEIFNVAGTGFDFMVSNIIAEQEAVVFGENKKFGEGFDHCYVLNQRSLLATAARLYSEKTGIEMTMRTNQPGLQLYTGAFLTEPLKSQQGACLEAQGLPDAVNQLQFDSVIVRPNQRYQKSIHLLFAQINK